MFESFACDDCETMNCKDCNLPGKPDYEPKWEPVEEEEEISDDDGLTDVEADAMTLASAGYGTDEDYGYYGGDEW